MLTFAMNEPMNTDDLFPEYVISKCRESKNNISHIINVVNDLDSPLVHNVSHTKTLLEMEEPKSNELYDTFDVRDFKVMPTGNGLLSSYISLTENALSIQLKAQILNSKDKVVLANVDPITVQNSNYLELKQDFIIDQYNTNEDDEIQALVTAILLKGDVEEELHMLVDLTQYAMPNVIYDHQRPSINDKGVIIGTPGGSYDNVPYPPSDDHIIIAFFRMPHDMSDVNYVCGFGNQNGEPNIGIPARGVFTTPNYKPIMDNESLKPKARCVLGPRNGGGKTYADIQPYSYDCRDMIFTASGNKLYYDMACAWNVFYHEQGGWVQTEFDYDLKIDYYVTDQSGKKNIHISERISSAANDSGAIYSIQPLYLMYGCLEENALITMLDGSKKKIKDLNIGEQLIGVNGVIWNIRNIYSGQESEKMIKIITNEESILLTKTHPVLTNEGVKKAEDLTIGMQIQCENEQLKTIESITLESYENVVYNVELESSAINDVQSHIFYANGIAVGDFILQNCL